MLRSKKSLNVSLVPLLSAACAAAALCLAGCDSGVAAVNKDAADASSKAARIAASAGGPRPTDSFITQLDDKDATERKSIVDSARAAITKNPSAANTYLDQKSVSDDLKTAAGYLSTVASNADFSDNALKSVIQTQLGSISTQQSQLQLEEADKKLIQLLDAAINFELAADSVASLGAQADVQDARAQASKALQFPNMQPAVDDAKAAVDKAQAALADLEKQASDKQAKANQIYSDTEAAFLAAESLKGNAAIDAAQKALEDRKAGDEANSEVIAMQPAITQARIDLAIAQTAQTRAEAQLASVSTAAKQADTEASAATDRAAILRGAAKKLLDGTDAEPGLASKYKDFLELAKKLDTDIAAARTIASTADKSYGDSGTTLAAWKQDILTKVKEGDPLYNVANDPQNAALIKLLEASAKIQLARVNLVAYLSSAMQADSAKALATVQKAAGDPQISMPEASVANNLQDTATTQFKQAVTLAQSAAASVHSPTSPAKWLGLALQSVALHGIYAATGQSKTEAETAAKSARDLNPYLNIAALTGAE